MSLCVHDLDANYIMLRIIFASAMSLVLADSITSSECDGSVSDIDDEECAGFIGNEHSGGMNEV